MKEPTLFRPKRICSACRAEATRNRGRTIPGEPRVQTVTPYLTWRGKGKNQFKKCDAVWICESCLAAMLQGGFKVSRETGDRFLQALHQSLRGTYNKLVEADQA